MLIEVIKFNNSAEKDKKNLKLNNSGVFAKKKIF